MKRLKLWLALIIVVIIIAGLVMWTRSQSPQIWLMILVWLIVIILLQIMLIYLVVLKNRHK